MSVSLAYVSVSGITRDTDMSTFMGLSPNKDLKNGLIGVSVPGIIYDLYYVIMNTDHV